MPTYFDALDSYYIYATFVDDSLRYIGYGKGDRYKHTYSGVSNVLLLNKAYFENKTIKTYILTDRLIQIEAQELEKDLIWKYKDVLYNSKVIKRDTITDIDLESMPQQNFKLVGFANITLSKILLDVIANTQGELNNRLSSLFPDENSVLEVVLTTNKMNYYGQSEHTDPTNITSVFNGILNGVLLNNIVKEAKRLQNNNEHTRTTN